MYDASTLIRNLRPTDFLLRIFVVISLNLLIVRGLGDIAEARRVYNYCALFFCRGIRSMRH